jgi:hypothetical protein
MPSLHFGYSLLIGLTIATIPLSPTNSKSTPYILPFFNRSHPALAPKIRMPSRQRMSCVGLGMLCPSIILLAIIVTANHFILDAVVGSIVCGIAWWGNDVLLNLLAFEDWVLLLLRTHKPESYVVEVVDAIDRDGKAGEIGT